MRVKHHWDKIYGKYSDDQVSWFQTRPDVSIELIHATGVSRDAQIIDVGGGTSTLVDWLLEAGFTRLSVLDVPHRALDRAKSRLGQLAHRVQWLPSDLRKFEPHQQWDVWHDRAVFHFLTSAEDRHAYRTALGRSVARGKHVIIATFGPNGPTLCSGLDVVRYSSESLSIELGPDLELIECREDCHTTPSGVEQQFLYCRFQRS